MVLAIARKPCPVIVSFSNPMRRKAAFTALLDIGRAEDRWDGKRNFPRPVNAGASAQLNLHHMPHV
jgi:hypothetical protein